MLLIDPFMQDEDLSYQSQTLYSLMFLNVYDDVRRSTASPSGVKNNPGRCSVRRKSWPSP